MKQFILQVPDKKVKFFTELIQSLGFVKEEELNDATGFEISEKDKEIVLERIRTATPDSFKDWDEVSKSFVVD